MTDLWYDVAGEGPPLVLLHEGVVDSRIWAPVVPLLAPHHRLIRYDQRGFGRSPMPDGPYSLVDDLVSVLDAAGAESAALAGASRGGNIALTAAVERPERVSALVLLGSGLSGAGLEIDATPEQEARWEQAEAGQDWAAMAEIDMEIWAPMGADPELRAMFLENAVGSNSEDPATDEPVADRVSGIAAPTLVITASRDVRGINELGDRLARDIPGAESAVIEDADHMIPWRTPEELSHLILDFLARTSVRT
ncbi:MAG TPA: alpha/beta fold hydrolase [Gaiellaceae bacterium]|nr:alpha/beta fold hydrolase [Gaiellaceae bacterium]